MPASSPTSSPASSRTSSPTRSLLTVDLGEDVRAAFTRREPGASVGEWAGFNLALHVADDPAAVTANRSALSGLLGAATVFGRQVHGTDVACISADLVGPGAPGAFDPLRDDVGADGVGVDALVTMSDAVALGVLVADCVPVLLADPQARVVATAHAGRQGLLAGVLQSAVAAMTQRGAAPGRIRAALGPAAGGCCYEVPGAMQEAACAAVPQLLATTTWGTPSLDLRAGCAAVLEAAGVAVVTFVGGCTIEDDQSFSYRRAQRNGTTTGRFAGVVRLLP